MKSNHIHVISKYFIPVTAGIEVNILNTYKFLVNQHDWQVTVHSCNNSFTESNSLKSNDQFQGIKVCRYPWHWFGYWPRINYTNSTSDIHKTIIALHNFDVFPHSLILLKTLLLKIIGRKNYTLILTPHGGYSLDRVWHLFPWWQRIIKYTYHKILAPWLINLTVDGVRAVSEWEKQEMLKYGVNGSKIEVIANGLEDEAYLDINKQASSQIKKQVKKWGKYLIQIGRVYPIKNYETVIRALPKIPENIKFIIVGPVEVNKHPDYVKSLQDLIKKLHLEDRVIFTGVIRGVDKYYAIKHSQMMVHMAEWESFCNVVHEGLSQGKICLVADNTALPLLIKDGVNGYCIETKDHQTLAKKINYVLNNLNSSQIKAMCKTNAQRGRDESWESTALKMNTWYRQLITHLKST